MTPMLNKNEWTMLSDGQKSPALKFGNDPTKHSIVGGEHFTCKIESIWYFENYWGKSFQGRKMGLNVLVLSATINTALINNSYSLFFKDHEMRQLVNSNIGINDYLSIEYKGLLNIPNKGNQQKHTLILQAQPDPEGQSIPIPDPGPSPEELVKRGQGTFMHATSQPSSAVQNPQNPQNFIPNPPQANPAVPSYEEKPVTVPQSPAPYNPPIASAPVPQPSAKPANTSKGPMVPVPPSPPVGKTKQDASTLPNPFGGPKR